MPKDLVGVAEIAETLGVSRQRVNQLIGSYPDFPVPEAELSAGRIWSKEAVESWMARHPERKAGRQEGRFVNFERFTDRARQVIVLAQNEGTEWGHNYLGCEHLLIGLLREPEGVGGRALEASGVDLEKVRNALAELLGQGALNAGSMNVPFTPRAKQALEMSVLESLDLGHNYIGTEHILLGIIRQRENYGVRILEALDIDTEIVRAKTHEILGKLIADKEREKPAVLDTPKSDLAQLITERFDRIEKRISDLEDRLAAGQ